MEPLLQEILDATKTRDGVKRIPWGQLRPLCAGATDAERMRAFMHWCVERGRAVTVPDLAGPNGLANQVLITIGRQ